MKATPHAKTGRVPKTIKIPIDMIRATNAAVEAGLASDFSDAVEQALQLLLLEEGFPTGLSPEQIKQGLQQFVVKKTNPLTGDPIVGGTPDQSKKQSGETKFSRGVLVVKDPEIEARRKKAK